MRLVRVEVCYTNAFHQQQTHNLGGLLPGLHHLGQVPHREILLLTGADPVALAEQFIDLPFRRSQ
jgi:hypothetical protein